MKRRMVVNQLAEWSCNCHSVQSESTEGLGWP